MTTDHGALDIATMRRLLCLDDVLVVAGAAAGAGLAIPQQSVAGRRDTGGLPAGPAAVDIPLAVPVDVLSQPAAPCVRVRAPLVGPVDLPVVRNGGHVEIESGLDL